MDEVDRRILEVLLKNSRTSLKELARQVGLSSPSTAERLRRLEDRGVVRGYTLELDPQALGYRLQAVVRIRPLPGKSRVVRELIEATPEFCECDKVTGDDCYIVRLFVPSLEQLDEILDRIANQAETHTAIVKSQPIRRRQPPFLGGAVVKGETV